MRSTPAAPPVEARAVAAALDLDLTLIPLPAAGVRAVSPTAVACALGQPTHSAAPFGFMLLYEAIAAAGCATVLTGDGADEAFAGHAYHRAPPETWAPDIWSTWAAVRALGVDPALVAPAVRSSPPWITSPAARAVEAELAAIPDSAARLRWLDLRLRQDPQCVALQRRLCAAAGLVYRAPLADPRVTARALAAPLDPARPKAPLVALAAAALGRPWRRTKQPMHALTGGRPLDATWRAALEPEAVRRHGLFSPAAVAAALAAHDPAAPWLPRALVIVATAHAGLDAGAFTAAQFRGASSSK
ncbi:MAG: asparagine synthase [Myxococcales bacterium]|nr:asparagine synthase [Myxococcales bacterium]